MVPQLITEKPCTEHISHEEVLCQLKNTKRTLIIQTDISRLYNEVIGLGDSETRDTLKT